MSLTEWRKPRRSMSNGACVETGTSRGGVLVRDSKDPSGAQLWYSTRAWQAFVARAKGGEFETR
jgi:hypothetical protein